MPTITERPPKQIKPGSTSFVKSRAVQAFAAATILAITTAAFLGDGGLPFNRPAIATTDVKRNLTTQIIQIIFALLVVGVAAFVTRNRKAIDFAARTPEKAIAKREAIALLIYGTAVLAIGHFAGIGMHLHGAIFGATRPVPPTEVFAWAGWNFLFFAVIPFVVFRKRGYNNHAMGLRSENLRNDTILIFTIVILESMGELSTFPGLFRLTASQLELGMPAAFLVHLAGTGIPVMIFVYALLFPRYVKATGSPAAAVILGALTYAGLHIFEYWTVYDSPRNLVLSLIFIFLQFAFPGLIKSFLTLRTGNAWVHLWAYHAFAPHVTVDTPLVVKAFGIK